MTPPTDSTDGIDWSLTTWEGARREQLRRWAELPLERIILALEAGACGKAGGGKARGAFRLAGQVKRDDRPVWTRAGRCLLE
jgi:hypothetical protein